MEEFFEYVGKHPRGCIGTPVGLVLLFILLVTGVNTFTAKPDFGTTGFIINYGSLDGHGHPTVTIIPTNQYTMVNPFAGQKFLDYPTRVQTLVMDSDPTEGEIPKDATVPCIMNGGGTIRFGLTINWQVDPAHPDILYSKKPGVDLTSSFNNDVATTLVYGAAQSDTTTACTKYTWESILGQTPGVSQASALQADILAAMQADLGKDGILVDQVFFKQKLPDQQISAVLNAQINAQQSAIQKVQAQNNADAQKIKANGDATAQRITAQANADSIRIVNDQLSKSSASYLQYLHEQNALQAQLALIAKWDGNLPQSVGTQGIFQFGHLQ